VPKVATALVVNDVVELRVYVLEGGPPSQLGVNVTHWFVRSVGTPGATPFDVGTTLDALFAAAYKPMLTNGATYRGTQCQKIHPLPVSLAEASSGNAGAGTGGAAAIPQQVAGLIKLQTDRAGRPFRGRIYIPFLPVAAINAAGNLNAPSVAALNNIASIFTSQNVTTGLGGLLTVSPCIWHRKGYGTPPAQLRTFDRVTQAYASPLLATIRKRGNYGQTNPTSPV
jgi:hypothetical protein